MLTLPRDRAKIAADVRDMRARIEKEKGTKDIWELKQVRGGLVDLEFIAQHLQLVHAARAPRHPERQHGRRAGQPRAGGPAPVRGSGRPAAGGTPASTTSPRSCGFAWTARLTPDKASDGLKALLARAGEAPDFSRLEADLAARQAEVASLFNALVA